MLGNLGYQSGWTDTTTGRVNMAARWYNLASGQFDSHDTTNLNPVPNSAAANPSTYANNNPSAAPTPPATPPNHAPTVASHPWPSG